MANRNFNLFAGWPGIGANIGRGIQQKGQQQYLTMLQQMQQEEERKYQESLPQYKMAEEKLRDMEKQAKIAANFIKAKSEITPFLTKSWLDKIIKQKEEEEIYGMVSQYPGEVGAQLYDWVGGEIESRREAESKRGLREAQRIKTLQPPSGTVPKKFTRSDWQQTAIFAYFGEEGRPTRQERMMEEMEIFLNTGQFPKSMPSEKAVYPELYKQAMEGLRASVTEQFPQASISPAPREIMGPPLPPLMKIERELRAKLGDAEVEKIIRLGLKEDYSKREILERYAAHKKGLK